MGEAITGTPRFEMRGIRKAFGATLAVDGVDLSVAPGEVCAIVGQNGAGKSTLMAILSGALQPDAGHMTLDGAPYRPAYPLDARRVGVAMIYQELSLAPHMTVTENILLGMEPASFGLVRRAAMRRTATDVLAKLGHPEISIDAAVETLSPAAQQLVEIGRALAVGCRVLVLDEPTSSLSQTDTRRLFALIAELKRTGHAIVYISHFIEEVKTVADRIVVLRDGKVAGGGSNADLAPTDIVRLMVGRSVDALYPRSPRRRGAAILELVAFGPSSATLTLHRGEVLGIAGLLGAGRTRLIRGLFGLEAVRTGQVRIGAWSGTATPNERWRQGIGFLSEDRKEEGLAAALSIADNLTLTRLEGLGPGPTVLPGAQDRAASRWMERLEIKSQGPRQAVAELSGGNQQKVALARLLHHDVDVLLLDEPTRGIDVASKAQIYRLIDTLVSSQRADAARESSQRADAARESSQRADAERESEHRDAQEKPRAVLMISSYVPELLGLCDRVAVMCRGRLGPPRPVGELSEHSLMLEATGAGDT